ncbi:hypothetical protein [Methylotuvimicrobium sp.]
MDRNIYHNVNEDLSIAPTNESARGGLGRRPDDHAGLSDLGL